MPVEKQCRSWFLSPNKYSQKTTSTILGESAWRLAVLQQRKTEPWAILELSPGVYLDILRFLHRGSRQKTEDLLRPIVDSCADPASRWSIRAL